MSRERSRGRHVGLDVEEGTKGRRLSQRVGGHVWEGRPLGIRRRNLDFTQEKISRGQVTFLFKLSVFSLSK